MELRVFPWNVFMQVPLLSEALPVAKRECERECAWLRGRVLAWKEFSPVSGDRSFLTASHPALPAGPHVGVSVSSKVTKSQPGS